jgi:hypothetical protein
MAEDDTPSFSEAVGEVLGQFVECCLGLDMLLPFDIGVAGAKSGQASLRCEAPDGRPWRIVPISDSDDRFPRADQTNGDRPRRYRRANRP